ncbi:unnamed protein product [Citrullus colocynthis]|uniref:Uncharacterized protein n=1 Tax=Citrullus colocynthis TaxID=252529 RepID=A0ABP0Y8G8_9ROSI
MMMMKPSIKTNYSRELLLQSYGITLTKFLNIEFFSGSGGARLTVQIWLSSSPWPSHLECSFTHFQADLDLSTGAHNQTSIIYQRK